jgi:hypothetical protein
MDVVDAMVTVMLETIDLYAIEEKKNAAHTK